MFRHAARAGVKAPDAGILQRPLALGAGEFPRVVPLLLRLAGLGAALQALARDGRQRGALGVQRLQYLPRLLVQQPAAGPRGPRRRVVLELVVLAGDVQIDVGGGRRSTAAAARTVRRMGRLFPLLQALLFGLFLVLLVVAAAAASRSSRRRAAVVVVLLLLLLLRLRTTATAVLLHYPLLLSLEPPEGRLAPGFRHDVPRGGFRRVQDPRHDQQLHVAQMLKRVPQWRWRCGCGCCCCFARRVVGVFIFQQGTHAGTAILAGPR